MREWGWGAFFGAASEKGMRLDIAEYRRPAPYTAPVQAKAAGLYMICTLSKHKAEARGYNDALMFDWRGQVAEGTGANAFFVKDGALHRSEEHTSELQSLMRNSYAVFCLKNKTHTKNNTIK